MRISLYLLVSLLLTSCLRNSIQYYSFPSSHQALPKMEQSKQRTIALGPVNLASYLDRKEIVYKQGEHRVRLAEQAHWAEPLDKGVSRSLRNKLKHCQEDLYVIEFPRQRTSTDYVQIEIELDSFGLENGDSAQIAGEWVMQSQSQSDEADKQSMTRVPYFFRVPCEHARPGSHSTASTERMIDCMDNLLQSLSRQICFHLKEEQA